MNDTTVLIVGAGPTGLVLALWLAKAGVSVRIIDKVAQPGTTSRAVVVQARTLEMYRQLGIADEVVRAGYQAEAVNLWSAGSHVGRISFGAVGAGLSPFPYLLIYPQDAHEQLLARHLDALGVRVERPMELVDLVQTSHGVQATLRGPDASDTACTASYIAACDGAHSKVRETLGIGFAGGTYAELFYVADVEATGSANSRELSGSLDAHNFVALFPLGEEGQVRLIGRVRETQGAGAPGATFADVDTSALARMHFSISKVNWFSTYKVHHRVADSFRTGRAFLLGDAAHVHSPAGGQGMNTGIGDAINLAWKLAAVVKGEATERLLDSYEAERIAFARKLVRTTDRGFTFATSQTPIISALRALLAFLVIPVAMRRSGPRTLMFRTISQIGIRYPDSFLSAGKAGNVRGGDRLPWVEMEEGMDNFTPLDSTTWQAHVYGKPRDSAVAVCGELHLRLHEFPWSVAAHRAGLARSALYLVRPDGYIALADRDGKGKMLRNYFAERGLGTAES